MYHSHERHTRSLESVVSGGWVFDAPTTGRCPGLTNGYQNLLRGNIASVCSASVVRWFEVSFRICDEFCHRIDSLLPLGNYSPSYVQLYVGGPPEVLEHCMQDIQNLRWKSMYHRTSNVWTYMFLHRQVTMDSVFNYISTTENMTAGVTTFSPMAILPSSFLITHTTLSVLATLSFTDIITVSLNTLIL